MAVIERRMVGPAEAAELLELNHHNRNISQLKVDMYADDMRRGLWEDNGVPIIIYRHGTSNALEDGQHRLWGVVDSGVTIPMTIAVVDHSVQHTVDIGQKRTYSQNLMLRGYDRPPDHNRAMTGLAVLDIALQHGANAYARLSPPRKDELLEEHRREVVWAANVVASLRRAIRIAPPLGMVAGAIAIYRVGVDDATRFFDQVAVGDYLARTDGAYLLRQAYLARRKYLPKQENLRAWYDLTVRAWNVYISGRSASRLIVGEGLVQPLAPTDALVSRVAAD